MFRPGEVTGRWTRRLRTLNGMLPQSDDDGIYCEDFTESGIRSHMLRDFYRYWRRLAGNRQMPETVEVDPVQIPRHVLPNICVVDVQPDDRFRYRVAGTRLVEGCGVEITGKYADEMVGSDGVEQRYRRAVRSRKPYHCIGPLTWSPLSYKHYETVVCPLSDPASGCVSRLIGAGWFD
jgi:hypothetical protein